MTTLKVIDLPVPLLDEAAAIKRLERYMQTLKSRVSDRPSEGPTSNPNPDEADGLPYAAKQRILHRVKRLGCRRAESAGLGHLSRAEIERLRPHLAGTPAVMPGDEHWADGVAAALHAEMPWMGRATEEAWRGLRRCAARGTPITLRPMILNGPYGIGKSVWARKLATAFDLPLVEIDASKGAAGFSLVGTERGWSTAQPGRPVEALLKTRVANPLCVVDEICKAGVVTSRAGTRLAFADAMLALLEPATAKNWTCPYFRVPFDMSHVSWVLTSNHAARISAPVLNRCQVIELPDLTEADLTTFARRRGTAHGLSELSVEVIVEVIARTARLSNRPLSLRDVNRLLERAEVLEGQPWLQ